MYVNKTENSVCLWGKYRTGKISLKTVFGKNRWLCYPHPCDGPPELSPVFKGPLAKSESDVPV
jgi:hypothetical protein